MTSESLLEYFAHNKLSEKVKMLNEITKFESILKNSLEQHLNVNKTSYENILKAKKLWITYLLYSYMDLLFHYIKRAK